MAIIKRVEVGQRNILSDGQIQVRIDTIVEEDGVEISRTYHRHVVHPGLPAAREDPLVQRIMAIEHTPAIVARFKVKTTRVEVESLEKQTPTTQSLISLADARTRLATALLELQQTGG